MSYLKSSKKSNVNKGDFVGYIILEIAAKAVSALGLLVMTTR